MEYENTALNVTLSPLCCRREKHFTLSSNRAFAGKSLLAFRDSTFFRLKWKYYSIFSSFKKPILRPILVLPWSVLTVTEASSIVSSTRNLHVQKLFGEYDDEGQQYSVLFYSAGRHCVFLDMDFHIMKILRQYFWIPFTSWFLS